MIKLLIADDEKIIRETISRLIDWEQMGIQLIGTAENGLEALNIILDESPEIVMTDIRMPGLSGLELIQQISSLNQDTEFIILSGYGEFEYAKEAMKYGVRHYLLKPCNETQIAEAVGSVKKHIQRTKESSDNNALFSLSQGILFHILSDSVSGKEKDFQEILSPYSPFLDSNIFSYTLYYLYYLEPSFLESALESIQGFLEKNRVHFPCFYIYVENTLLFFYRSELIGSRDIEDFLNGLSFPGARVSCLLRREIFGSLSQLLHTILPKLIRYETIYLRMFGSIVPLSNKDSIVKQADSLTEKLLLSKKEFSSTLSEFENLFKTVKSLSLIQQIGSIIFSKILSKTADNTSYKEISLNAFAPAVPDGTSFFPALYRCETPEDASVLLIGLLKEFTSEASCSSLSEQGELSKKIKELVALHLANPNLSLKWISEQILFMNSDYVSKRFIRETGEKFSHYLAKTRVAYAKQLLLASKTPSIQEVAWKVGCGNNPLYFSQLFKKYTGMTPTSYIKKEARI